MPNKWTESHTVERLQVDTYLTLMTNWEHEKNQASGYYISMSFSPVKFRDPSLDRQEAKKRILSNAKVVIQKMLVDINQAIEEEEKEQ